MALRGGFDVHRAQITFDYLDTEAGEVTTGQMRPATRLALRSWSGRFDGRTDVAFAMEGCTGWRFVVEELRRAGSAAHLAEPADTATHRGRKKRAKTDRADARLLRELLRQGRLPASWMPPAAVLEVRTLARLYVALMAERRAWQQRIHAQVFHQGVPSVGNVLSVAGQAALAGAELSPAGRQVVDTAGLAPGRLARQGSPELRWALYEAAKCAARPTSPDHAYSVAARDRLDGKLATLSVARKLARRCYHTLRRLGDA